MILYKDILEVGPEIQEKVRVWRNSPRVKKGMLVQADVTGRQHRTWLDFLHEKRAMNKVRVAFSDRIPFGIVNLRDIDENSGTCDWGVYIGEDAFLGRGLGRRLVFDTHLWGFGEQKMRKMHTSVRADNLKALFSYLELGHRVEGLLQDHIRTPEGDLIGVYLIAQFCGAWDKNKEKASSWGLIGE